MMDITRRKLLALILATAAAPKGKAAPTPFKPGRYWKHKSFSGFKPGQDFSGTPCLAGQWIALRSDGIHFFTTAKVYDAYRHPHDLVGQEAAMIAELASSPQILSAEIQLDSYLDCSCTLAKACKRHENVYNWKDDTSLLRKDETSGWAVFSKEESERLAKEHDV